MPTVTPLLRVACTLLVSLCSIACDSSSSNEGPANAECEHVCAGVDDVCPAHCETSEPEPESPLAPPNPALVGNWTLTGDIVLEACPEGSVETPLVYVALCSSCGDWSAEAVSELQTHSPVPDGASYVFKVESGKHQLQAFADCDANADLETPSPSPGDLVYSVQVDPSVDEPEVRFCRRYSIYSKGNGFVSIPLSVGHLWLN